jgi:phosphoribosylformimino-5-aminoimidazole carboxamide ribotide isomerase
VRGRRFGRVILYPAIDIRNGRAVRLMRGDYEQETVYDADPLDAARRWADDGARFVHVVDLDGAREGRPANLAHVRRIAGELKIPVQLGGGLRDVRSVAEAFEAGAARAVLGTAAVARPELVAALVEDHGDRILASVDARGGRVSVAGWTEMTGAEPPSIVQDLAKRGVERFVFTPVDVDGSMEGPGVDELRAVAAATSKEVIYSGGVGSLDDLTALRDLRIPNLGGVIVGRALYERRFTVAEGQAALD